MRLIGAKFSPVDFGTCGLDDLIDVMRWVEDDDNTTVALTDVGRSLT